MPNNWGPKEFAQRIGNKSFILFNVQEVHEVGNARKADLALIL